MSREIQVVRENQPVVEPRNRTRSDSSAASTDHRENATSERMVPGAVALAIAPAVMMTSFLLHPHIGNPTDADFLSRLGAAVEADTVGWAVAHLLVAVGSGLIAVAFLALRSRLRDIGEDRFSRVGLPFIVMGSLLYAMLPAMEFAPLTAAETGADAAAAQGALLPWFAPTLFSGALIFAVGAVAFAMGIVRTNLLSSPVKWVVASAIVVMAAARLVPLSVVQFHVQGIAGIVALWPLAYALWKR